MREPSSSDFNVEVPDFGTFIFARRRITDTFKIRARYHKLTEGYYDENNRMADLGALGYVTIGVLLVSCPESFNFEALDPLMDDDFDSKIVRVYAALVARERSFRPDAKAGREGSGTGAGGYVPAVVPQDVQPGTDGPAVP